jgi:hypothetical protein
VASTSALAAGQYALETSVRSGDGHQLVFAYGFAVGPVAENAVAENAVAENAAAENAVAENAAGDGSGAGAAVPLELAAVDPGGAPLVAALSGTTTGARSVGVPVPAGVTGGEVRLTCRRAPGERVAKVRAPFVWKLAAPQDGMATASGYLPVPCTYTVRITLERPFPASPVTYVAAPDHGLSITPSQS